MAATRSPVARSVWASESIRTATSNPPRTTTRVTAWSARMRRASDQLDPERTEAHLPRGRPRRRGLLKTYSAPPEPTHHHRPHRPCVHCVHRSFDGGPGRPIRSGFVDLGEQGALG